MRFLLEPPSLTGLDGAVAAADLARRAGLDGLLLSRSPALPAPLVAAAAVAGAVDDLLIAADVALGDRHPLEVVEEAIVVDQAARGRLVVVLTPAEGTEDALEEALDLVQAAATPRPLAFEGRRWRVPARLEGNTHRDARVRVTPAPYAAALTFWLASPDARAAARRGIGHLAPAVADDDALRRAWTDAPAAGRFVPRGRREEATDPDALLSRLRQGRAAFTQDWAVISGDRDAAAAAAHARARLQLDSLPPGLEDFWRTAEISERTVG